MKLVTTAAVMTTTVASNLSIAEPQMPQESSGEVASNLSYAKPITPSEALPAMTSSLSYMRPETPVILSITSGLDE